MPTALAGDDVPDADISMLRNTYHAEGVREQTTDTNFTKCSKNRQNY